ncbi:FliH/SctL family protein [Paenibacillus sp. CC-CFT747]|nr:FliH/SctL family protein [Paenibacillus sp. CC-CFT747]
MSNLIKPNYYVSLEDSKIIDHLQLLARKLQATSRTVLSEEETAARQDELNRVYGTRDQILKDAEEMAEATMQQAAADAQRLREETQADIRSWWEERRQSDEQEQEEAKSRGFEAGYQAGLEQARQSVREEYADSIQEAQTVLAQAYERKRQIIREAEPFLIELSTSIAEKIIQKQLSLSPDWILDLTRSQLARKRDKGIVTLCVAPKHFTFFKEAREEFEMVMDSQAELQIVPDATVSDEGCVIRTDFGSMDARIDTQLQQIKETLRQIALRSEAGTDHDELS